MAVPDKMSELLESLEQGVNKIKNNLIAARVHDLMRFEGMSSQQAADLATREVQAVMLVHHVIKVVEKAYREDDDGE